MKRAIFHNSTREIIRSFPDDVRGKIGHLIWELQLGHSYTMPLAKLMPAIASSVYELRIKEKTGNYRVLYYLKSERGILIFHAFYKKTQKTPLYEIRIAKKHLKELLNEE